jgi:protocatechuate 3,4-dioxygenase beta subunit
VKPKLAMGKLAAPSGDETLSLSGIAVLATTPTVDPATNGVRILVTANDGSSILDVIIPGGVNWITKATRWIYRNKTGFSGITKVVLAKSKKVAGQLKMTVKGAHATFAVAPTDLPVTATVVIDAPTATTGQCAAQTYTGPAPTPTCTFNKKLTSMKCK